MVVEGTPGHRDPFRLEEAHELFGNVFLMLVLAHVALIAAISILRRQNQALPMFTGRVRGKGPDLVRHNRTWLAGLLLLAVVALGAWQWQDSPRGWIPIGQGANSMDTAGRGTGHAGNHDPDDDQLYSATTRSSAAVRGTWPGDDGIARHEAAGLVGATA